MKKMNLLYALIGCLALIIMAFPAFAATTNYLYDDLLRLKSVTRSDGVVITYNYDEAGNRKRKIVTVPAAPVALFGAAITVGVTPLEINFTDQSTGNVNSWLWDFGDGSTSVLQHPSHTYIASGIFNVSLAVSGPGGNNTLTKTNYVTASSSTCTYSISPTSLAVPAANGSYSLAVTASSPDCQWTATTGDSWITFLSGFSGMGSTNLRACKIIT